MASQSSGGSEPLIRFEAPRTIVLGHFQPSLRDWSCCASVTQHCVRGYFQPKLSKLKRYVIAGVDFAGLTPRKSANRESGSWQVRVRSGPELLITGSKHPGLHPGPFSAIPPGLESRQAGPCRGLGQIQSRCGNTRSAPLRKLQILNCTSLTFSSHRLFSPPLLKRKMA